MTPPPTDRTGAPATITLQAGTPVSSYILEVTGGDRSRRAGRMDFLDAPAPAAERIIFHTEVGEEFAGRGLAELLAQQALADSISAGLTVVPVCPYLARYLSTRGEQFAGDGGSSRQPTAEDVALVTRSLRADR